MRTDGSLTTVINGQVRVTRVWSSGDRPLRKPGCDDCVRVRAFDRYTVKLCPKHQVEPGIAAFCLGD